MRLEVLPDLTALSRRAAAEIASAAREAVRARGRFLLALSGAATARPLLRALADEDVPWGATHLFQVDERVAPAGHVERNLTDLQATLVARVPVPAAHVHPMPVAEPDLGAAAARHAAELAAVAGSPPVLDLVHLGIGEDGHTASLVSGDPALGVADADVAVTGAYQGRRRMTLTYPALERARRILWVIAGAEKASALARLRAGDRTIPAGRVRRDRALVLADAASAGPHP
jgi:6-phosphogluconolactonase